MDKSEKGKASDECFSAHCFPVLNDTPLVGGSEAESDQCTFQPIYKDGQADCGYRPSDMSASRPDQQQAEDATRRKQESYERGVAAGQQDAQCLLQEEITPALEQFKLAIDEFGKRLGLITRASSRNIARLADEIVRKILSESPALEKGQLDTICQAIMTDMCSAYGLRLQMNPDDLEKLTAMLKCDSSSNMDRDTIRLIADDGLQKGALTMDEDSRNLEAEPIEQMLAEILDAPQASSID